jgi:hypothetical protein
MVKSIVTAVRSPQGPTARRVAFLYIVRGTDLEEEDGAYLQRLRAEDSSVEQTYHLVGIASVVALQLVGANFRDAVTGNAQKLNRGDAAWSPKLATSGIARALRG